MTKYIPFVALCCLLIASCGKTDKSTTEQERLTDFVDPFIGTAYHGHTYPGAAYPFGQVQLSPDNGTRGWDWCSGYHYSDSTLAGFSHLHLSGTGIGDLADISFLPVTIPVTFIDGETNFDFVKRYSGKYVYSDESASP
jgi:putative alpha-1,2-mannosidase